MDIKLAGRLLEEGLIGSEEYETVCQKEKNKLFSLHWELKTMLYLGVLMLAGGMGMLVYLNIDTIGHQAILALIGLGSGACFYYCHKRAQPFSLGKTQSDGLVFDYLLLLACLLFLTFEGYLQYQYEIFGNLYGLATFIPSMVLLFVAYRYDHKGILSLGITGLAAWAGLSVTPLDVLKGQNNLSEMYLVWTALAFSGILSCIAVFSGHKGLKAHFTPTYLNFTINILFLALLAGLFMSFYPEKYLFFILIAVFVFGAITYARRLKSFYYLLIGTLAGYIAATYIFVLTMDRVTISDGIIFLYFLYFILSCGLVVYFITGYKKLLQS